MASSGGTDPAVQTQLAQGNSQFDTDNWVNMSVIQSTMSTFSDADLTYAPPMDSHHNVAPQDTLNRMRPLQPRLSQDERDARDRQQQEQENEKQQQQQQQQQQQSPLHLSHHLPHLHQYLQPHLQQQTPLPMVQPTPQHQHHAIHHDLPQLNTLMGSSNPTWPSMLISNSYSAASAPMPVLSPAPAHVPASLPPSSSRVVAPRTGRPPPPLKTKLFDRDAKSGPRKMLTDDDRRRMCQYAEAHPGVKQSEIGNLFGVERSTVSKVLRKREKYLREDRSMSPGSKKAKNKFPDVERALSNWVRNAQKTGVMVTDAEIQDKFRFFAASAGSPDTILKANNGSSWLDKFKQRNGIGSGRLVRRASETNIPDHRMDSLHAAGFVGSSPSLMPMDSMDSMEAMDLQSNESPLSPVTGRRPSASPFSAGDHRHHDERDGAQGERGGGTGSSNSNSNNNHHLMGPATSSSSMHLVGLGLTTGMGNYKHSNHNQSTTSLSSVFTETPVSSFPSSALSPTAPFPFSPDANDGAFLSSSPMPPPGSSNFQRPRSQTLPALFHLDFVDHDATPPPPPPPLPPQHGQHNGSASPAAEAMTPKYRQQDQQQQQQQQQQPYPQQHQHQHAQHRQQHHHHQQHPLPQLSLQQQGHRLASTAPSSAVDSPMTDISMPSFGIDSTVVSPQLRRSSSSSSLLLSGGGLGGGAGAPRSAGGLGGATLLGGHGGSGNGSGGGGGSNGDRASGGGGTGSAGGGGGGSGDKSPSHGGSSSGSGNRPSQDDARRAADTLLTFIQTVPGGFDQNDHNVIARLVEKLRLQGGGGGGGGVTAKMSTGISILSRIPEGEGELGSEGSGHHQHEHAANNATETQMAA